MVGTKCRVVTRWRSTAATMASGSRSPPGASRATRAPSMCHQNSSHTETSKETGVFCRIVSASPIAYARCIQWSRLTTLRCSTTTPLGAPVEPEV